MSEESGKAKKFNALTTGLQRLSKNQGKQRVSCPDCGARMRRDLLKRHMLTLHGNKSTGNSMRHEGNSASKASKAKTGSKSQAKSLSGIGKSASKCKHFNLESAHADSRRSCPSVAAAALNCMNERGSCAAHSSCHSSSRKQAGTR